MTFNFTDITIFIVDNFYIGNESVKNKSIDKCINMIKSFSQSNVLAIYENEYGKFYSCEKLNLHIIYKIKTNQMEFSLSKYKETAF